MRLTGDRPNAAPWPPDALYFGFQVLVGGVVAFTSVYQLHFGEDPYRDPVVGDLLLALGTLIDTTWRLLPDLGPTDEWVAVVTGYVVATLAVLVLQEALRQLYYVTVTAGGASA